MKNSRKRQAKSFLKIYNKNMKKFLRFFLSIIFIIPAPFICITGSFFYLFFSLFFLERTGKYVSHFFYALTSWWLIFFFGGHVHVEGRENLPKRGEAVLYTPNHNSFADIPLFFKALHRFPPMMAKKEMYYIPAVHSALLCLGCIKIDRSSPRGVVQSIIEGEKKIKNGESVVVFPEGTRSKTGEVGEFKNGAFKIAERTGCRIIPVVLKNDRYLMENSRYFGIVQIYVKFLPPINTNELSTEERKNLHKIVEEEVKREFNLLPSWPKKKS